MVNIKVLAPRLPDVSIVNYSSGMYSRAYRHGDQGQDYLLVSNPD